MVDVEKYKKILKELEGKPLREKNIRVAGIITDYVQKKHGIKLIVVGGLSVEFYTDGGYATQDIDFVGPGHEEIMNCLVDLGFTREGKDSVLENLEVYVEVPSSTLNQGDLNLVHAYKTVDGFVVNFIGVEDIFWDRLRARIHSKERSHMKWLTELYLRYKDRMDLDYLKENLIPVEREFLDKFIARVERTNEAKSKFFDIVLFMDDNDIVYSTLGEDFISLNVSNGGYIGLIFNPILMIYEYDDENEEFVPISEHELSAKDASKLLQNYDIKNQYKFKELGEMIESMYQE